MPEKNPEHIKPVDSANLVEAADMQAPDVSAIQEKAATDIDRRADATLQAVEAKAPDEVASQAAQKLAAAREKALQELEAKKRACEQQQGEEAQACSLEISRLISKLPQK